MKFYFFIAILIIANTTFSQTNPNHVWVAPSNGNNGYWRTAPNGTVNDNFSAEGNYNPYTGEAGTKPRDNYNSGNYGQEVIDHATKKLEWELDNKYRSQKLKEEAEHRAFMNKIQGKNSLGLPYPWVCTTDANLRSGAGKQHGVIVTMEEGDLLDMIVRSSFNGSDWYMVRHRGTGISGYVHSSLIEIYTKQL